MDMYWVAFYQYPYKYLGIDYGEEQSMLNDWDNLGRSCSWWYPFENIVFISDRPQEINKNTRGQLHADLKPALLFRDGYCLWMLNGISMPKEIVLTPAEELNSKILINNKNAEVRREIIKKIGYSRILKDLKAKNLDSWREYELYRIDNVDVEPINLLKMICPSTGSFYALRVPPDITKANEAAKWVNNGVAPEEFLVET